MCLMSWFVFFCAFPGTEVREVDLKALTGGIVHTKLWVVDHKHLYVGSANMDWRSLSQVDKRTNTRKRARAAVHGSAET